MIQRVYLINYGSRDQLLAPITSNLPMQRLKGFWIGRGPCDVAWESLEDLELLDWIFFFFRNKNVAARGETTTANNLFFSKCDLGIKGMVFCVSRCEFLLKTQVLLLHGVTWVVGWDLRSQKNGYNILTLCWGPCRFFHHIC